jgi:predicted amidohydrolase YtcJ
MQRGSDGTLIKRLNQVLDSNRERNRYREGPLGVVQVGAYADFVIVDGNPLKDVTILSDPDINLMLIMKDGVIYKNTL